VSQADIEAVLSLGEGNATMDATHANNAPMFVRGPVRHRSARGNGNSNREEVAMAKAYWVAMYHSISNPDAWAAYAKIAVPAITEAGGRFLARGAAAKAYEKGLTERVVIVEFDSVDKAVAVHDGAAYQAALKALGNAVERDLRIVEGVA
jgi:uncharacterized protein (DUF1330 family)